jgi:hypothetical protein
MQTGLFTGKTVYPVLYRVRQHMEEREIADIPAEVTKELDSLDLKPRMEGMRIAVTAGSRGIHNIDIIVKSVVDYVKRAGGYPFIVPAMGSHGGATAEGQREVIKGYGIDEETMGCPVLSSMEVVQLGTIANGAPVYFDKNAYESDGIIVVNRVKPHTDFSAPNESGIVKMLAIGLGKEKGCSQMHAHGLAKSIPASAAVSLEQAPILCGLGIVENSRDKTFLLKAVRREDFLKEDARLLKLSYSLVPHLPVDELDLLVVKEIGKIFSGTGMDTKTIGRIRVRGEKEPEKPDIHGIVALRMNEHSYGNALGIGLADITTKALVDQIDRQSMYSNLIPTTFLERGKIPAHFDTEEDAMDVAMRLYGHGAETSLIIAENTLEIEKLLVSKKVLEMAPELEVIEEAIPVSFDGAGRLKL